MYRIMIIEDDAVFGEVLKRKLEERGHRVSLFHSVKEMDEPGNYDIILLDLMLPYMDGFEILKEIRKEHAIPVIIISALTDLQNKLKGFDRGADDFLTKPFDMEELLARIEALMRRVGKGRVINLGEYRLLKDSGIIVGPDGREYELQNNELRLLERLLMDRGKFVSKEELARHIWGEELPQNYDNAIRVYIVRLRNILGKDAIKSKKRAGDMLDA